MRPSHAIYRLSPFAAIVLLCAICLRAAAISDFTGIYTSEKLTLALQADPASALRYTGTLTLGKTTYPCRGSFDPLAGFAGSFSSGSEQFSFSLIQDAQGFTLTSGGTQYALKRQAGAVGGGRSPLEPSPAAPTQPAGAGDHRIVEGKLPEYMKRGFQLSYEAADQVRAGVNLVRDPNGNICIDGVMYRMQDGNASGGAGIHQVTIAQTTGNSIAAEIRNFGYVGVDRPQLIAGSTEAIAGNADALGDYWVHPARLAHMEPGRLPDGTTIFRQPYAIGKKTFNAVTIYSSAGNIYISKTYDLATGALLFGGETTFGSKVNIQSGIQSFGVKGDTHVMHKRFVGGRQIESPWADEPMPRWAAKGLRMEYRGALTRQIPQIQGLPQIPEIPGMPGSGGTPTLLRYDISDAGEGFVIAQVLGANDLGGGLNMPDRNSRCFSSAHFNGLWISPRKLRDLKPNQVLDQEPITGYTVTFSGVQGNVACLVSQGALEQWQYFYSVESGMLVGMRGIIRAAGDTSAKYEFQLVQR